MELITAIKHLTFPRYSNNHKAKLIQNSGLLLVLFVFFVYQIFLQITPAVGIKILGFAANISTDEVIRLTNEKRAEAGLPPVTFNESLSKAAREKGENMLANDYWAHVAPDGTTPWKFFNDVGYKYKYAGENLARDFSNAQSAVDAWMASPSHRENMLSSKYKEIGIAVVEGDLSGADTTIIVQLFGTSLTDTSQQIPVASAKQNSTEINNVPANSQETTSPFPTQTEVLTQESEPPAQLVATTNSEQNVKNSTLISPFVATKSASTFTIVVLMGVMTVDWYVVWKRKIVRPSGRTFAHLAFLGMILAVVLIAKAGKIL